MTDRIVERKRNRLSRLTMFMNTEPVSVTRVIVPGGCTVRLGGHEVHLPVGEERVVGPLDTCDYEIRSPLMPNIITWTRSR